MGAARSALAYLILAIVLTWPLARHLSTRVPHDLGDPLLVAYLLNWNARVVPLSEAWWHPPFFWPTTNVMALSEHLLGLSLVASPLQWLGLSPLAAYNVLFIASFWSAGMGGWILGRTLTGHPIAALVGGLVFMCAPYRASHLAHLQILVSCGVPVLLAALHRATGGSWRWVLLVAACWLWQGVVSGYYLAFLPVVIGLWLAWFAPRDWRLWAQLGAAGGAGAAAMAPILLRYAEIHSAGGYERHLFEVLEFSADVAGLWQASDHLAVWGPHLPTGFAEQQLFAGGATLILAALSVCTIRRSTRPIRWTTTACLVIAVIFAGAAAAARVNPGEHVIAGVRISMQSSHKPLAIVWMSLLGAAISSRTLTEAWRARSAAGGYLILVVATWILALGPAPTLNGFQIWHQAPYSWLYEWAPGFDEFRVPARFFIMTVAALAALAAVATARLLNRSGRWAHAVVALLSIAVVAEGWLTRLPLVTPPRPIVIPPEAAVVLELPGGDPARDASAMFRSLDHGRPVINGWSGYAPPSSAAVVRMERADATQLVEWARQAPVAIIIDRAAQSADMYERTLRTAGARCQSRDAVRVCVLRREATPSAIRRPDDEGGAAGFGDRRVVAQRGH